MPLPRFTRLAESEQQRLLAAAMSHVATRGIGEISLNDLADDAGISRSALYNYFDGRDDVIAAATEAAFAAVADALGPWEPHAGEAAFWASFHSSTDRLRVLLAARPELRTLLKHAEHGLDSWIDTFFTDAVGLGIITAPNQSLARAVTGAILAAADALELAHPGSVGAGEVQQLLQKAWS